MEAAIDALKLFIRSMPTGATFSIKSFGSRFSDMKIMGKTAISITEHTKNQALEAIS